MEKISFYPIEWNLVNELIKTNAFKIIGDNSIYLNSEQNYFISSDNKKLYIKLIMENKSIFHLIASE